jgi:hypothetical protein
MARERRAVAQPHVEPVHLEPVHLEPVHLEPVHLGPVHLGPASRAHQGTNQARPEASQGQLIAPRAPEARQCQPAAEQPALRRPETRVQADPAATATVVRGASR